MNVLSNLKMIVSWDNCQHLHGYFDMYLLFNCSLNSRGIKACNFEYLCCFLQHGFKYHSFYGAHLINSKASGKFTILGCVNICCFWKNLLPKNWKLNLHMFLGGLFMLYWVESVEMTPTYISCNPYTCAGGGLLQTCAECGTTLCRTALIWKLFAMKIFVIWNYNFR